MRACLETEPKRGKKEAVWLNRVPFPNLSHQISHFISCGENTQVGEGQECSLNVLSVE